MIAILVVLAALPLGYLCRERVVGYLVFIAAFAHVYAFQTLVLVMEWVNGSDAAFARDTSTSQLDGTLSYFAFTTVVYAAGFALVHAGQVLRMRHGRRSTRRTSATAAAFDAAHQPGR